MTEEERRAASQILLAFEDVATWYEEMAQTVHEHLITLQQGGRPTNAEVSDAIARIVNTLRHLEAHQQQVDRMRTRLGL